MSRIALYRKWRPKTFEEVVGQEHVTQTLKNALATGRVVHAYLFSGPRGTGKTTTARILAKGLDCLSPQEKRPDNTCRICQAIDEGKLLDLIEIDAASHRGIDEVRELREKIVFAPSEARYKVYIIDEVHMLTAEASNALLKTLEEPPRHAYFILATTEPHKILPTILSRCQRFDFRPLAVKKIVDRLKWIVKQEDLEAEEDALELIARQANGSMRDADSLLDQVTSGGTQKVTVSQVQAILGTVSPQAVSTLAQHLAVQNLAGGLQVIGEAIKEGADPRQLARQLIEYLRGVLLIKVTADEPAAVSPETAQEMRQLGEAFTLERLTAAIRFFNRASWDFKASLPPELPLEMAFVDSVLFDSGEEPPVPETPRNKPTVVRETPTTAKPQSHKETTERSPSPRRRGESPEAGGDPEALAKLITVWDDFLAHVRSQNLRVEALLKSCQPLMVKKDTVVLGFYYPFHKGQIENARNRELVEEALGKTLGHAVAVKCVLLVEREKKPTEEDALIKAAQQMGAEVSTLPTASSEAQGSTP